jgi:hypothetical protein
MFKNIILVAIYHRYKLLDTYYTILYIHTWRIWQKSIHINNNREGWMKVQNCVYKLSVSSNKYPLLIIMFHNWSKHNFRRNVMSCHVCLLSPGLCLDHIQQSALNRYWYGIQFVSCQSQWLATASNSNIVQHSTHMQQATHSKTVLFTTCNTGMLQVTYCSLSLLLYDLQHR